MVSPYKIPLGGPSYSLDQRSPNFFVRGPHKLLRNSPRPGHHNVIVSVPSQLIILLSHYWQNSFAGRIWPAGRSLKTPGLDKRTIDQPISVNVYFNYNLLSTFLSYFACCSLPVEIDVSANDTSAPDALVASKPAFRSAST